MTNTSNSDFNTGGMRPFPEEADSSKSTVSEFGYIVPEQMVKDSVLSTPKSVLSMIPEAVKMSVKNIGYILSIVVLVLFPIFLQWVISAVALFNKIKDLDDESQVAQYSMNSDPAFIIRVMALIVLMMLLYPVVIRMSMFLWREKEISFKDLSRAFNFGNKSNVYLAYAVASAIPAALYLVIGAIGEKTAANIENVSASVSIPLILSQLAISVFSIFMAFSCYFVLDEYRNSVELGRKHISFTEAVVMSIKTMTSPSHFFKFFGASLLMSVIVMFGFLFFIVPGLIFSASIAIVNFTMYERFRTESMVKFVKTA